ncbi:MAG: hypothetical protein KDB14_01270 [Planctomycetales bacterium]|nr:hypothetical protein [Planctomycetales bacterium]
MTGRKRGRHTSAGKDLERSIRWLERRAEVQKVVLSIAEACRTQYHPGHLRVTRVAPGGLKVVGHTGNGVINLFVRVADEDRDALAAAILEKFGE